MPDQDLRARVEQIAEALAFLYDVEEESLKIVVKLAHIVEQITEETIPTDHYKRGEIDSVLVEVRRHFERQRQIMKNQSPR